MITLLWILAVILVLAGIVTVVRRAGAVGRRVDRDRPVGRSRRGQRVHLSDQLEFDEGPAVDGVTIIEGGDGVVAVTGDLDTATSRAGSGDASPPRPARSIRLYHQHHRTHRHPARQFIRK